MEWTESKIKEVFQSQRDYFQTNETLPIKFRIEQLKKLKSMVLKYEEEMVLALKKDLGRHELEAYLCDIGSIIVEVNETIKGLKRWAKPKSRPSGLICFPSLITKIYRMPYGVTLIISPFNFPFLLTLGVLIASIAGGNTAILKLSSKSKYCTEVLVKMISETFDSKYVIAIDGGHDVADYCLNERCDKIFYTGSPNIGKHVLELASKNLTPVALELGGETGNWCVIRKDANLKDAARKIAFFKACNSGQICININQIAIAKEVATEFIECLKEAFEIQLGSKISENDEYSSMINERAFTNCLSEMELYKERIVFGGDSNKETLKISPTIIYPVKIDEPVVNHELFNPLLPIVEFDDDKVDDLMRIVNSREHGLALYLFTKNKKWAKNTMTTSQYGGGCINEVCIHMMVKGAPFNGVGHSGMGAYHGEYGFNEFTHPSSVLKGSAHFNLSLREHPYNGKSFKKKLIKKFEK